MRAFKNLGADPDNHSHTRTDLTDR